MPLSMCAVRFLSNSCVISGAFEPVCGEVFGNILALSVSHIWNHQILHCSIISHTTSTSSLSCIHVNTTSLLSITCTLVVIGVILERLECDPYVIFRFEVLILIQKRLLSCSFRFACGDVDYLYFDWCLAQWSRRFVGIIGWDPSVCKSN